MYQLVSKVQRIVNLRLGVLKMTKKSMKTNLDKMVTSHQLTNLVKEIMELRELIDGKISVNSKNLVDEELLLMSTKLDKLIFTYLKQVNKS